MSPLHLGSSSTLKTGKSVGSHDEFAQELADERNLAIWSTLLLRVPIEQVTQVGIDQDGPASDSRASRDRKHDGGVDKSFQAGQIAQLWLAVAAQQMRGLTSLYEDQHRLHAPRPLLRSIIEHAARAAWLLDGPGPDGRAGRVWVSLLRSGADQVDIFERTGELASAPERYEHLRAAADELFDPHRVKTPDRSWKDWSVNGEKLGSLTAVVEQFVDRYFPTTGSGRSYYGILSLLQHPTPAGARAYGEIQGDTLVFPRWDVRSTMNYVSTSVASWHVACRRFLEHMGWSCPEFDAWSDAALAALGWAADYPWPEPPD